MNDANRKNGNVSDPFGVPFQHWLRRASNLGLILMMGVSMSAYSDSWKEEALLHDGSKVIVSRTQDFGGRHELGQSPPIKEQTISFVLPNTRKQITFKNDYGEDIGRANFMLLALHILNGTPYLVTAPNLCLSYNKWGRPNPPYVVFKHDANTWQRISLEELPAEFKDINLVINTKSHAKTIVSQSPVSAELVRKLNGGLTQSEFKVILREPLERVQERCGEMVYDGRGGWHGIGWFNDNPSGNPTRSACLKYCDIQKISMAYCPCNKLFKEQ